jgi:hypothetical protein
MYIKRFESVQLDYDMESCKDLIECIGEFEEGLEAIGYEVGYYDSYYGTKIRKESQSENSKRALSFFITIKDFDGKIVDKNNFDKTILLAQRCKYLYSKFEGYCEDIIVDFVGNNSVKFLLQFENTDTSEKKESRIKRVLALTEEYFNDWRKHKTFHINRLNKNKYIPILEEIKKTGPIKRDGTSYKNPVDNFFSDVKGYYSIDIIEFRFGVKFERDNDYITITPNSFKWKSMDIGYKKIKSSIAVMTNICEEIINDLSNNYKLSREVYVDNFSTKDGVIKIKVS